VIPALLGLAEPMTPQQCYPALARGCAEQKLLGDQNLLAAGQAGQPSEAIVRSETSVCSQKTRENRATCHPPADIGSSEFSFP
jgi:hypothetical protein